ncbi:MBL fold metallo-hydrolase [Patescibacteria group bacterium]|nr:MBL fold metallo-hydrolase [Patescibacteria group bacterium]MBU1673864.1 MBL fold metallo-hydrolase [Patescibacteria group bacterium]MBU1963241.1 MBL fold metallo-hydrolase [Patescibacteria group bacterium]
MKLTFLGAAGEVTGSSYLVETESAKFLVDCGMFQGGHFSEDKNLEKWKFEPAELDFIIITHSHLDHCGRLPKLVKNGFKGKIYSTHATSDFMEIFLADSAHVIRMEARRRKKPALYEENDVKAMSKLLVGENYNEKIQPKEGIEFRLRDAGHILGSAIIELWIEDKKIVFSGDLGNPPVPIVNPPEFIDEADYVLLESTYGGRVHEDSRTRRLMLSSAIYEVATMKGILMIPAFAMERTQEVLFELNALEENNDIPPIDIYLDSPLAIKAMSVFRKHEALFNVEAHSLIDSGDDIFDFSGLTMTESTEASKAIKTKPNPKMIIAGSGMCHGGRIMHHLKDHLGNYKNQVLIVGYQVKGTLGRRLVENEKVVRIYGQEIKVEAKTRAIGGYSAHGDQPKLLEWVEKYKKKPKGMFIVHGEPDQSYALADAIKTQFDIQAAVPSQFESVDL